MNWRQTVVAVALLCTASPSLPAPPVSTIGSQEIIVTGLRREMDNYDAQAPAVGLRKVADFAIQPVIVTGDTRDPDTRHEEMYQTIRNAIALAGSSGVQLAFGDLVVEPLTLANYRS